MKIEDLKFGKTYLVEVAFTSNNVIHRAILTSVREYQHHGRCGGGEPYHCGRLFTAGYENDTITTGHHLEKLPYLTVIQEIDMTPSVSSTPALLISERTKS